MFRVLAIIFFFPKTLCYLAKNNEKIQGFTLKPLYFGTSRYSFFCEGAKIKRKEKLKQKPNFD